MPPLSGASGAHWPSRTRAAELPSHRRNGVLQAEAVRNSSGGSSGNSTTTFVQVMIEQNSTTFKNDTSSTSIPTLQNESTVGNYNFFEGPSSFSWTIWNPSVLWLFCSAAFFCTACVMGVLALRRYENSFSCRSLQAMGFMFSLASMGYLLMALGMGHLEEVYGVEVFDGIVENPGRLKWRATTPPIVWMRHVTWAATTCIQLHMLMALASNGKEDKGHRPLDKRRSRRSQVVWEVRFYIMALNLMMHVSGLIGTVVPKNELSKWLYWIFACALFSMICNQLTWAEGHIWRVATKVYS